MKRDNPYPGLHPSPKRLADGTTKTYFYAWKGGPRIDAEFGSPEFARLFLEFTASRAPRPAGAVLLSLFNAYQFSRGVTRGRRGFLDLAPRTQADYAEIFRRHLEPEFGDLPLAALDDPGARAVFLDWRDRLAETSPRRADYAFTVLARVFAWALDRRMIRSNPCERAGRVWRGSRREIIWTDDNEARFLAAASAELRLAYMLGAWTGQRPGELRKLMWTDYEPHHPDGPRLLFGRANRRSKTGVRLAIPVGAPLRAALDAAPRRSTFILTNSRGVPWTEDGFNASWRKAALRAKLEPVDTEKGPKRPAFGDLRGTAVTRLRALGCTTAEICAITGHKNAEVNAILETHYAATDPALARGAILKLEARTKSPNRSPNRSDLSGSER